MVCLTLGPEGTLSQNIANIRYTHKAIELKDSVEDIFQQFSKNEIDSAIVPFRTSASGFFHGFFSFLINQKAWIHQIYRIPSIFDLVGPGPLEKVHTIFAEPFSYNQCQAQLRQLLPNVEVIYTASNGLSLQKLKASKSTHYAALIPTASQKYNTFSTLVEKIYHPQESWIEIAYVSKKQPEMKTLQFYILFSQKGRVAIQKELEEITDPWNLEEVSIQGFDCHCYFLELHSEKFFKLPVQHHFLGSSNGLNS